jgi:hypothetical protein
MRSLSGSIISGLQLPSEQLSELAQHSQKRREQQKNLQLQSNRELIEQQKLEYDYMESIPDADLSELLMPEDDLELSQQSQMRRESELHNQQTGQQAHSQNGQKYVIFESQVSRSYSSQGSDMYYIFNIDFYLRALNHC